MTNHYTTLGLTATATLAEIKTAYRKLASEHHPDKGGDKALMQAVNAAYEVLSDPRRRELYDLGGEDYEEELLGFLVDAFREVIRRHITNPGFRPQNIVACVLRELDADIADLYMSINSLTESLDNLRMLKSRVSLKEGRNVYAAVLEEEMAGLQGRAANMKERVATLNLVRKMAVEYEDKLAAMTLTKPVAL